MPPKDSPYGDEVSDDEQAELDRLMKSNEQPEPDEQNGASTDGQADPLGGEGEGDDDDGQPKPKPAAQPQPGEGGGEGEGEGAGQSDDEKLAAFLEKHKGKSPEELARLAFQQNQRASRAEFDFRKSADTLKGTLERINTAREAATARAAEKRAEFQRKLAEDPDAALLEARSQQLSEEERAEVERLEAEEFGARAAAAVEFAAAVIPEFETRAPQINAFGRELGFGADELNSVVDGRQIVTLHLASIAGNMIKAGLIDPSGRFIKLPEPVADLDGGNPPQQRPGFSRQPARGAGTQKSLEQQLKDVDAMTDEELDKLDPAALEALLRAAEG